MKDLKIRVNNKSESKEVQELFFELDYKWFKKGYVEVKTPETIMSFENGALSTGIRGSINHKEITLPELRDLVVLKRNNVGDATHGNAMYPYVKLSDGWYYFDKGESNKWLKSAGGQPSYYENLKPIEKPMKEYLNKETHEFVRSHSELNDMWIEIPEWAVACADHKNGYGFFYDSLGKVAAFHDIVWLRKAHPEDLPFVDDDPKITTAKGSELDYIAKIHDMRDRYDGESDEDYRYQLEHYISRKEPSLNDQYAEIETVRQSHRTASETSNPTIKETLNQRQSQYGSFEDVAQTTEQLFQVIKGGASFVDFTESQRMALYMIFSKVARLSNGDCNHKDSWHDIAGYAILIDEVL